MHKYLRSAARWMLLLVVAISTLGFLASGLDQHPASAVAGPDAARPVSSESLALADSPAQADKFGETVGPGETAALSEADNRIDALVADLDAEFARQWEREQLESARPADWLTICRRLSLALVGSTMSLEEIRNLEGLPVSQRVPAHRERLLADKRFADYWAERLARSVVGAEEGPFLVYRRRRFVTWLSEQIATNRPYDEIVRQLITANGFFTDRPEVNFVTVTMESGEEGQPDPIRLAGRTTRAFLAMRIDCLQCHDDFLGNVELGTASEPASGRQQDFHQLAAFYSDSRFNILQGIRTEPHPYQYTYLYDTEETTVEPKVPFLPELMPGKGSNAERLAGWVTHPNNRQAARAIANRVWALMFGQPLHAPVDDIPLHGPLPAGLDRLADGVNEFDWDLRQLVRVVSQTNVFQLASRADFEISVEHEKAWAVYPLIRLRPEQVAGSVIQASRLTTIDDSAAFVMQMLAFGTENDFVTRYGDTGEDEFKQENVTVTQRLLMMNGEMVRERTAENPILNASSHIRMFSPDDAKAVEAVYLAVLNRYPSAVESRHFLDRMDASENRQQAVEDIYWVLLNSSELAWNH
ncbi:DUF1553 domain-containing protein [Planctomycetaceae bacterium SH139]